MIFLIGHGRRGFSSDPSAFLRQQRQPAAARRRLHHGRGFFQLLRDAFDWLYRRGSEGPRMLTISLHGRIIGRPGRIGALERLLDHIQRHEGVWLSSRASIAQHWRACIPRRSEPPCERRSSPSWITFASARPASGLATLPRHHVDGQLRLEGLGAGRGRFHSHPAPCARPRHQLSSTWPTGIPPAATRRWSVATC